MINVLFLSFLAWHHGFCLRSSNTVKVWKKKEKRQSLSFRCGGKPLILVSCEEYSNVTLKELSRWGFQSQNLRCFWFCSQMRRPRLALMRSQNTGSQNLSHQPKNISTGNRERLIYWNECWFPCMGRKWSIFPRGDASQTFCNYLYPPPALLHQS